MIEEREDELCHLELAKEVLHITTGYIIIHGRHTHTHTAPK